MADDRSIIMYGISNFMGVGATAIFTVVIASAAVIVRVPRQGACVCVCWQYIHLCIHVSMYKDTIITKKRKNLSYFSLYGSDRLCMFIYICKR